MPKYIEKGQILLGKFTAPQESEYARGWDDGLEAVAQNAPAANVVPVVRGEWEWQEEWGTFPNTDAFHLRRYGWYCTSCGIELGEYLSKGIGHRIELDDDFAKPDLKYCPNCGADMRGEST